MKYFIFLCTLVALTLTLTLTAHTNPLENRSDQELWQFAVISDMNQSYGSTQYSEQVHRTIQHLTTSYASHSISQSPSQTQGSSLPLVLSTGDMVAGQKQGLNYKAMWSAFHRAVTGPLTRHQIAFAPSPGNHDASIGKGFQMERQEYRETFLQHRPSPLLNAKGERFAHDLNLLPGSQFPLHYAFLFRQVLFVAMDTTGVGPFSQEQWTWLQQVLKTPAQFKVVFGHMPLLPFAFNRTHEYLAAGNSAFGHSLEKLLDTHRVDLFLSGHHHAFYPGHRKAHTRYISVPCLGSGPRALVNDSKISETGFLIFEVHPQRGIEMKAYRSRDLSRIDLNSLPRLLQLPKTDSASCKGCARFPSGLFLDGALRTLYLRAEAW